MSEENIENITKSDSNIARTFVDHHVLPDINFNGNCLISNNISVSKEVINLYISQITNPLLKNLNADFRLMNWLFGSTELTKMNTNVVPTAQDLILVQNFHLQMEMWGKNVIILRADMGSSVHIDDKNKVI